MRKTHFFSGLVCAIILILGVACNSNSSQPGTCTNCSAITPETFVNALVSLAQSGEIPASYANSTLAKSASLQKGYFIIWDGFTQSYEAVYINTTPNIYGTTESSACSEKNATCSNMNPTEAAKTFANAGGENHTKTVPDGNGGSATVVDGTQFGGDFGHMNFPDPYDTGTPVSNTGSVNYFPVAPNNSVVAPTGGQVYQDGYNDGILYSNGSQTKDVDLQAAQLESATLTQRAAQISAGLQMDFHAAMQLTELADRIQMIQGSQGQLTDADRNAVTQSLLGIAGVSPDELSQAVQGGAQGDMNGAKALLGKVSRNLGMPEAVLRNQVLPKLGVSLN